MLGLNFYFGERQDVNYVAERGGLLHKVKKKLFGEARGCAYRKNNFIEKLDGYFPCRKNF